MNLQSSRATTSKESPEMAGVAGAIPSPTKSPRKRESTKKKAGPAILEIAKCPLFCCFYAEFDNKVGPVVSYEAPLNFMEQKIESSQQQIHATLKETLTLLQATTKYKLKTHVVAKKPSRPPEVSSQSASIPSAPSASHRRGRSGSGFLLQDMLSSGTKQYQSRRPSIPTHDEDDEGDHHDEPVTIKEGSLSIFDSCSEYIITGNELTGNLVNLSTHHFHVLSRPTVISDERYERNSLLFAVGFVLRRAEDPRPFRPILSKLAVTLRDVEVESQFLSNPATRPQLQDLLEHVLVSFNSTKPECNMYLNAANFLNLKLFQPPRASAAPVPDYAVPLLLQRDWQYTTNATSTEWDLSINWVLLHIDGMANAKQISVKSEVDMEMVRACLRVLKHHGVIACVDMFLFSNQYETTAEASALLSSQQSGAVSNDSKPWLLQAAVDYCVKRGAWGGPPPASGPSDVGGQSPSSFTNSPSRGFKEGLIGTSSGSGTERWMSSTDWLQRSVDYREVEQAIAELYSLCRRDLSIGDLWLGLVTRRVLPMSSLNWKRLFNLIDHRRFVSFGIVHGLIHRVHRFPILMDRPSPSSAPPMPPSMTYVPPPIESVRNMEGVVPERFIRSQSTSSSTGRPSPDWQHTKMVQQLSAMLDGRHCDDELVTHFERPLDELLDLFSGRRIVSVYSTASTAVAKGSFPPTPS